jgi:hypothetical protein
MLDGGNSLTARSNWVPQMARVGAELIFAWTGGRVFTAKLALPESRDPIRNNKLRS